ncbi:hypothetical protein WN944_016920 [Citrus x changshan-huyou]|uniref:Uncharacterized protein n=1 Tax=Citrus x changshan-huyou TaxID=2935761 RepID=A0AAP0MAE5_9ROSI
MDENHLHLQTTIEWLKGASIIHGQGLLDTSALEGIQVLRVTCRIFTLQLHHTNSPCRNLIFSLDEDGNWEAVAIAMFRHLLTSVFHFAPLPRFKYAR